MPQAYRINNADVLMIGGDDAVFHARVTRSLEKIRQAPAGAALLDGIRVNRTNGANVGIVCGANECACVTQDSSVSRTRLAQTIFDQQGNFAAELALCMAAAPAPLDAQGTADLINAAPVYDIRGAPNHAPSALGVTAAHVQAWLNGTAHFPQPFAGDAASRLQRAFLTAMWPRARLRPGTGGHSRVRWNPRSQGIALTTGVAHVRSKSIGLAHELVHAYYNGSGLQMGLDNPLPDAQGVPAVPSAALFEYMCVGLGIWANEPISENAIRSQWHTVVSYTLFGGRASVRYGATAARPCY